MEAVESVLGVMLGFAAAPRVLSPRLHPALMLGQGLWLARGLIQGGWWGCSTGPEQGGPRGVLTAPGSGSRTEE